MAVTLKKKNKCADEGNPKTIVHIKINMIHTHTKKKEIIL